MTVKSKNITKVEHRIVRDDRWAKNGHKGSGYLVYWAFGIGQIDISHHAGAALV